MNLNKLLLIQKIKNYQPIPHSIDDLAKYFNSSNIPEFLFIPTIIFESNINITFYYKIKNYINTITDWYCQLKLYNLYEIEWYKFYILLRAYKPSLYKDAELIVRDYKQLLPLYTNQIHIKWIAYEIKKELISYYLYLGKDPTLLIQEVNNSPQEIKNLHF